MITIVLIEKDKIRKSDFFKTLIPFVFYFSVPGIIGCIQALEALKIAAGLECILKKVLVFLKLSTCQKSDG